MMQETSHEVVLLIIMILLLISVTQLLDTAASTSKVIMCEESKDAAERIKRMASGLKLDVEDYIIRMEGDSCGG